jgi:signal transduction histidine kinase
VTRSGPPPRPWFRDARGRRPQWWPEDEDWPPARSAWAGRHARRFRRRVAVLGVVVIVTLVGIGVVIGSWIGNGGDGGRRVPYLLPALVLGFVLLAVGTRFSRRLTRPVRGMLESAERIGAGDYTTRVQPDGPAEVRRLVETFNTMADRLETADTDRRRFLADVTHELRTPIAILQSGIEAQLDGVHPRDDAHLTSLLDETQRLGRLVDDLHTLALLGANKLPLHREPTDVAALIDDAVDASAARASERELTLTAAVAPGLPALDVDPRRIRQVLDNLIANALRHTPVGGRITVSAAPAEVAGRRGAAIAVADTGPGIDPDRVRQVFDRYVTTDDRTGSGLGLAITRDLVEAHGGTVDIATSAAGTTVTFMLPARSGQGPT